MRKLAIPAVLLFAIGLIVIPSANGAAAIKPGAACPYQFENKTYKGKMYTCVKVGKKWVWDKGVVSKQSASSPSPTPSPSPTKVNDLAGLAWIQKSNGVMNLSLVMKSIKTNDAFLADGLDFQTAYPDKFTPLDIWQDKLIACPSSCITDFYVSSIKSTDVKLISLDKIQHPDIYSYSILRGANFGQDSRYVFALTSFNPIDGVRSVIYRIDTLTGARTPIYTTYCYSTTSKSCAYGYRVSGMKADHHSNQLAISVEAIGNVDAGFTSSYLVTMDQTASAITLKSYKSFASDKRLYYESAADANLIWRVVDNVTTGVTIERFSDLQFMENSDLVYVRTAGEVGRELNKMCVLPILGRESCSSFSPFTSVSDLVPLNKNQVLFSTLNFNNDEFRAGIFDISTKIITPVNNYSLRTWIRSFSVFG